MTYRFTTYTPPADNRTDEEKKLAYDEERAALEILNQQYRRGLQRDELARQAVRARMAQDAEQERLEREHISNIPTPATTEYSIAGLHFVNGVVVNKPTPQISQAVIKTEQLRAANLAALRTKK